MTSSLDDAPCGFLSFDDDSRILETNATLERWLGRGATELLGQSIECLLPPGGAIFHQTHFFPLLKMHGEAGEIYLSLRGAGGTVLPMLVNARRRQDGPGMRNDCILVPMRKRHQFEEQLVRARKAAEKARDAKARFLSMMAHEVRTPLGAITGLADILKRGLHGSLAPEQQQDVELMLDAALGIDRLVRDILDYARAEAGHDPLHLERVNVADALDRAEGLMRTRWPDAGLTYQRDADCADCCVRADPARLQQILLNLLSNAAKFTPAGGTVRMGCRLASRGRVAIDVTDTGTGIPADQLDRIFEPFVQAHRQQEGRDERGAGLGLAISRQLAAAMEGSLVAASTPGEGSVFTLTLLNADVAAPATGGAGPHSPE